MKFKNDKSIEGELGRSLSLTDNEGDMLRITNFAEKGRYQVIIGIDDKACVGLSRAKALKLAWAIIDELTEA
jgi:hypothetical protein